MSIPAPLPKPARLVPSAEPAHASSGISYLPEENPFQFVYVDVTHRCNMACRNCFIPNRSIPDMDAGWLAGILARLPRPTFIRIVGAEATVREDLPELVQLVRRTGHHPVLLTNGLRMAQAGYVRTLKQAGLRTVYLSCNGGLRDDLYEAVDGLACARQKLAALENLCRERFFVSVGMILVPGVNDRHLGEFHAHLRTRRAVRELKLRSIGPFGRYMDGVPRIGLGDLIEIASRELGVAAERLLAERSHPTLLDFQVGRIQVQLTEWPDLGSTARGRLTPEGRLEPFFEHMLANEGGY